MCLPAAETPRIQDVERMTPNTVPHVFSALLEMIESSLDRFARMFSAVTGVSLAFIATLFLGFIAATRTACQAAVGTTNLGEKRLQALRSTAIAADLICRSVRKPVIPYYHFRFRFMTQITLAT